MTGIIVGRFQAHYLHVGHLHLISTALRECDQVVIALGCHVEESERNPYDYFTRWRIIKRIFPQVQIEPIYDQPSDKLWSKVLDEIASKYPYPRLYHSRDSFIKWYDGEIKFVREVDEVPGYSATKIREQYSK